MKRLLILLLALSPFLQAAEQPNVLIIMADDCTHNDLPIYGGLNAKTPHIDRLASQGLTFNRAYLAEAMCQPCRAELFSGQYPMRNGCAWNHSASRPSVTSMPQHLGPLGYRVGLCGKVHVAPKKSLGLTSLSTTRTAATILGLKSLHSKRRRCIRIARILVWMIASLECL